MLRKEKGLQKSSAAHITVVDNRLPPIPGKLGVHSNGSGQRSPLPEVFFLASLPCRSTVHLRPAGMQLQDLDPFARVRSPAPGAASRRLLDNEWVSKRAMPLSKVGGLFRGMRLPSCQAEKCNGKTEKDPQKNENPPSFAPSSRSSSAPPSAPLLCEAQGCITAKVPFDFTVGKQLLASGEYCVRPASFGSSALLIRTADGQLEHYDHDHPRRGIYEAGCYASCWCSSNTEIATSCIG